MTVKIPGVQTVEEILADLDARPKPLKIEDEK